MKLDTRQRTMLIVLSLINFFNYLDRNVIFPLFHLIKVEFHVNDFQLGLLGTLFLLVHSLASVPLGVLADRYSRKVIIASGVFFWSIASFFTGLVSSFRGLLTARSLVGIGEASYAPAATSMISDNFSQNIRSQAQGIYNVGLFIGGTLGAIIGGLIAYYFSSWRLAFFIVSVPGIILAFLTLRLHDVRRHTPQFSFDMIGLFKNAAYIWMLVSGTLISFSAGGMITWGVEFITRYHGYNLRDASVVLGLLLMLAGVLGILIGGYLADVLHRMFVWGRSLLISLSLIIGAPFMFLGFYVTSHGFLFLLYFFIGIVLTSFYYGPAIVVMHDVVPRHLRSTAYAIYLLVIHLLGDTIAPALIGRISDMSNLRLGLEVCALAILLGGFAFVPICFLIRKKREFKNDVAAFEYSG